MIVAVVEHGSNKSTNKDTTNNKIKYEDNDNNEANINQYETSTISTIITRRTTTTNNNNNQQRQQQQQPTTTTTSTIRNAMETNIKESLTRASRTRKRAGTRKQQEHQQ